MGDVRGLQPAGDAHVGERLLERLFRQRVHQIQIEVGEPGRMQLLGRAIGVLGRMNAPQPHERRGSEALRPQRNPGDAGVPITGEAASFHRAGIGLQGDFRIRGYAGQAPQRLEQPRELLRGKQTRSASTEKDRLDRATADRRQLTLEVVDQRVDVARRRSGAAPLVGIEVAVRTLAHAPGHVHVERQRHRRHVRASSLARSSRMARPRWLSRFFSPGSSSAAVISRSGSQKYGS